MLRRGARTFELVRQLEDDRYQFEDSETRHPHIWTVGPTVKAIQEGKISVVLPGDSIGAIESGSPQSLSVSKVRLTDDQQKILDARLAYVIALRRHGVTRGNRRLAGPIIQKVAEKLRHSKAPSTSTVLGWMRRYERCGCNPAGLYSGNWRRSSPKRLHPRLEELIAEKLRTVYLQKHRYSIAHTRDCILTEAEQLVTQGQLVPSDVDVSISTLARRIREIDRYTVIARRYGPSRAKLLCRTPMGDDPPEFPLERIEIDHTPLNWVVICDRTGLPLGRPHLTAAICAATGYVTGIYLSFYGPGLTSVSGVVRNAISPKNTLTNLAGLKHPWLGAGCPDLIVVDNGLEFHSPAFRRMAAAIGSDLTFSGVRTPWSKPHIERFFADLNYLTLIRGRIHKRITNVLNIDPKKSAAITFSKLVIGLVKYVVDEFPLHICQRRLERPIDRMEEGLRKCPPAQFITNTEDIRLATAISRRKTVSQGGIEMWGVPFGTAELLPMRKRAGGNFKADILWDPDDINQIWVIDPQTGEAVSCPSRWPHITEGLSANQLIITRQFMRKVLKLKGAEEDLRRARMETHEYWQEAALPQKTADALLCARLQGFTSARVMEPSAQPKSRDSAPPIASPASDASPKPLPVIPDFDTFEM